MTEFHGEGPGTQARDGCSVALYEQLPYRGELEALQRWLRAGCTVLELGCGAGRLTRRLVQFGCQVTAVDNSAEMLESLAALQLPGVRSCQADIETLALPQRFEVVLLASGLINHADAVLRDAFLRAAAKHLQADGHLLLERQDAGWLRQAQPGALGEMAGIAMTLETVERPGDGTVAMTLAYRAGAQRWRHSFRVVPLEETQIEALLAEAGLGTAQWLEPGRRWAVIKVC